MKRETGFIKACYLIIGLSAWLVFQSSCSQVSKETSVKDEDSAINVSSEVPIDSSSDNMVVIDEEEFTSTNHQLTLPSKPVGWVNDFEGIFSKSEADSLELLLSEFETETSIEIVIVTIERSLIAEEKFDSLITGIGRHWGVGKVKVNNGIVVGLSSGLKKVRISTGLGIERRLTDKEAKRIIDRIMIPYLKEGRYFDGLKLGILEIMRKLR